MTRFYDRLVTHMETYVELARRGKLGYEVPYYEEYLKRLRSPDCKRFIFDARQAALFDELAEAPPENIQRRIHAPFPMFYLEFTEPITLAAQEPGYVDLARALLFTGEVGKVRIAGTEHLVDNAVLFMTTEWMPERAAVSEAGKKFLAETGEVPDYDETFERTFQNYIAPWVGDAKAFADRKTRQLLQEYSKPKDLPPNIEATEIQFVDRAWTLKLNEGLALSRVIDARGAGSELPEEWEPYGYFLAGEPIPMFREERQVSWWEAAIRSYTDLLSWICAYTMAKSVRVVEEPLSRQVRRWHERKNVPLPKPWHIVKLEPKFSHGGETAQNEGQRHRYRYDVVGHLRFGRHPRADGTFSETIEWVPPHQRGLENELYIPKTYRVERGKVISPLMRRYYGQ
jgi:hypothetical protein